MIQVERTTAIIADLELFRGSEPDGGTIFEMGWIWQKGGKVYGYTRDKRSMAAKNQATYLQNGVVLDQRGKRLPYKDLPFCPNIMGSSKIIEGDFNDALKVYLIDLEEERKGFPLHRYLFQAQQKNPKRVFIASSKRYDDDYTEYKESIRSEYKAKGLEAVFSGDLTPIASQDPLRYAQSQFECNMTLLSSCSAIVADLNNFHGFEPNNDVSFECGVAWGMGIKCIGFTDDARIMRERIPHYENGRDWYGNNVENFNLPINLMFGSYFNIIQGSALNAIPLL